MLALEIYLSLLVFYTLYIAAINMYYDWGAMDIWVKIVFWPIPFAMVAVDFLMQITLFAIIFVDLPREPMVTQRLERYRTQAQYESTWRRKWATFICVNALNPFDPTKHHC